MSTYRPCGRTNARDRELTLSYYNNINILEVIPKGIYEIISALLAAFAGCNWPAAADRGLRRACGRHGGKLRWRRRLACRDQQDGHRPPPIDDLEARLRDVADVPQPACLSGARRRSR